MSKIISEEKLYSAKNAKIGLLGGTFDPPHLAHLHMAQAAKDALSLDFVAFMPLGVPPHGKSGISDACHRIAMLEIILAGHDDFYIDAFEAYSESPSYTVRSVERIQGFLGEGSAMCFIVGADSLMYLEKWFDAAKLFEITDFAVIPREGYGDAKCLKHIEMLEHRYNARINYINAKKLDYSSTYIRENTEAADIPMTTKDVYKYIKENNLYG